MTDSLKWTRTADGGAKATDFDGEVFVIDPYGAVYGLRIIGRTGCEAVGFIGDCKAAAQALADAKDFEIDEWTNERVAKVSASVADKSTELNQRLA